MLGLLARPGWEAQERAPSRGFEDAISAVAAARRRARVHGGNVRRWAEHPHDERRLAEAAVEAGRSWRRMSEEEALAIPGLVRFRGCTSSRALVVVGSIAAEHEDGSF